MILGINFYRKGKAKCKILHFILVLIPDHNEANTIHEIIKRVKEVDLGDVRRELIIVAGASKDGTREILDDASTPITSGGCWMNMNAAWPITAS